MFFRVTVSLCLFCSLIFPLVPLAQAEAEASPRGSAMAGVENQFPVGPGDNLSWLDPIEPNISERALTLQEAIRFALIQNPQLKVAALETWRLNALVRQAGLPANPEIAFEIENFEGNGTLDGFGASETTVQVSQFVELWGKRKKRKTIAQLERDMAGREFDGRRIELETGTSRSFYILLIAQERQKISDQLLALANEAVNAAQARVTAGRISPLELTRARVELAKQQIQVKKVKRQLAKARSDFSLLLGVDEQTLPRVSGTLDIPEAIPALANLQEKLNQNPWAAQADNQVDLAQANLKFTRVEKLPDVTFWGGYRRSRETDEHAFVAGISVPLPLFDRNQGAKSAAVFELAKARKLRQAAQSERHSSLQQTLGQLDAAHFEVRALEQTVLPGARQAYEGARYGFRQGKFDFLFVMDTQRTFFEAKGMHLDALESYYLAATDLERLIAQPLALVGQPTGQSTSTPEEN